MRKFKNTVVLCDFDGTISRVDVGYMILDKLTRGDWEDVDKEFREGRIGSREAYKRIIPLIRLNEGDLKNIVSRWVEIDRGFRDFYYFLKDVGVELKIISDGFDKYIDLVLKKFKLNGIDVFANEMIFLNDNRVDIRFPFANLECFNCGNCKLEIVRSLKNRYDDIIYIGDGISDQYAAVEANQVFAKGNLYRICVKKDVPCIRFHDFHDITDKLKVKFKN